MDESEVIERYSETIIEFLFENKEKGSCTWTEDGLNFYLDFFVDHKGGLEGFYVDTYSGSLYIDNKAYYVSMEDVFCSETKFDLERDEAADLRQGDHGYVDLSNKEGNEEGVNLKYDNSHLINTGGHNHAISNSTILKTTLNTGETKMTNSMQVVTVILVDQDDKLKGTDLQIVGKFEDVVVPSGQDEMTTLLKLALNGDVKKMLDVHNEKRCDVVNSQTLERTGKKVYLQPITIEDVKVLIK